MFIAIGHAPATELFVGQVDDEAVRLHRRPRRHSTATSVPGVFAAGDVTDDIYPPGGDRRRAWAAWPRSRPRNILAAHAERRAAAE